MNHLLKQIFNIGRAWLKMNKRAKSLDSEAIPSGHADKLLLLLWSCYAYLPYSIILLCLCVSFSLSSPLRVSPNSLATFLRLSKLILPAGHMQSATPR